MEKAQIQKLKQSIDSARVVSFDLYGTLVLRSVKAPSDIFTLAGYCARIPHFTRDRKRMQIMASRTVKRKYGYPHATLKEIYRYWKSSNPKAAAAEEIERMLELRLAFPNKTLCGMLHYAKSRGKRVILTSDMYMEKPMLMKILKECKIAGWDELYVSSEIKKTKYQGLLYAYIIQKEGVPPGQILHIGDDKESDVQQAEKYGLHVFYYKKSRYDYANSIYGRCHGGRTLGLSEKSRWTFWYLLGYRIGGPLYLGLSSWLLDRLHGRKLHCLSRDGYNLVHLLPQLGTERPAYIPSSRRALILPCIRQLGKRELALLPPYSCGQTVREVLDFAGMAGVAKQEIQRSGFRDDTDIIRSPGDIGRLKRIYQRQEALLLQRCEYERDALEKYYSDKELFGKEMLFFDSGWNGTSQYLTERIYKTLCKESSVMFYYAGVRRNKTSHQLLSHKQYDAYLNQYIKKHTLNKMLEAAAIRELFFSQDAPALHNFDKQGMTYEAYHARGDIRYINQGIQDYIIHNKALFSLLPGQALEAFGAQCIARLILSPDTLEAERIGGIKNIDGFSASASKAAEKYIGRITRSALKKNPFLDIYWERGIYRNPQNPLDVKLFVWFRQRAAHIKRVVGRT